MKKLYNNVFLYFKWCLKLYISAIFYENNQMSIMT